MVRRHWRREEDRQECLSHLVSEEGSVQRNRFTIGICDGDLLRAGGEAGSYNEKSVGILEGDAGGFSIDGDTGATLEAAAAYGDGSTTDCCTCCDCHSPPS